MGAAASASDADDALYRAGVEQMRRERRARRLETRWASFEVGFGTGADYEKVARLFSAFVGSIICVTARGGQPVDVALLDAGADTGAITVAAVNDHGTRRPGAALVIPYEEIVDVQIF